MQIRSDRVGLGHLSQDPNQPKNLHRSDQIRSKFSKFKFDLKNRTDPILEPDQDPRILQSDSDRVYAGRIGFMQVRSGHGSTRSICSLSQNGLKFGLNINLN